MLTKTPFLTGFPTLLSGRAKKNNQDVIADEFKQLKESALGDISQQFANEIPAELLQSLSTDKRNRVYNNTVVFWAFLAQTISDDKSCQKAVIKIRQWKAEQNLSIPSSDTGAYCNARERLQILMLQSINQHVYYQLNTELSIDKKWRGFDVYSEDGTCAHMPDTEANQEAYPQSCRVDEGCGFPVARLCGLINLGHGGLPDFSISDFSESEQKGHDQLKDYLSKGDLLIGDRLYSSYEIVSGLKSNQQVEYIGRNHQARKVDFRKGKKISRNQRIVEWTKPQQHPGSCLSEEQWNALPDSFAVRLIRTKGPDRDGKSRTLYVATTLLDHEKFPEEEILSLYAHRWEIEMRFKDIKTTMGMEMLRTKKPELVHKEILMFMIAYNLIRLLMLKTGNRYLINHRRLSFKAALQVIEESRVGFIGMAKKPRKRAEAKEAMLAEISEHIVKERPGRSEPRRKKRRFKPYGWIQKPRHEYFSHFVYENPPEKILDSMC